MSDNLILSGIILGVVFLALIAGAGIVNFCEWLEGENKLFETRNDGNAPSRWKVHTCPKCGWQTKYKEGER